MKKLNLKQMEHIIGGKIDCDTGSQLAFIAGVGAAGTAAGPFGFLGGVLAGTLISIASCYGEPA